MQIFMLILYLCKFNKIFTIQNMLGKLKIFAILSTLILIGKFALAATSPSNYMSANSYNNLYPYMNNTMRTQLNPGTTPSASNAQINVLTRTKSTGNTARNVVPRTVTARSATNNNATARAATTTGVQSGNTANTARVATSTRNINTQNTNRRVVARSGTTTTNVQPAASRASRGDMSVQNQRATNATTLYDNGTVSISSARCMADYIDCMNDYCEREDAAYNRCYCSSKLAQIDATYQPEIDRLIKEILTLKGTNNWTEEEMNEYWMEMIGKYTGDNSWVNLDEALDIDWSSTESRVRGQQAFVTGHSYCVQHLRGCSYMATNMRDAYRSEISRDCATYENSLKRIKNAAESIVEAYKK